MKFCRRRSRCLPSLFCFLESVFCVVKVRIFCWFWNILLSPLGWVFPRGNQYGVIDFHSFAGHHAHQHQQHNLFLVSQSRVAWKNLEKPPERHCILTLYNIALSLTLAARDSANIWRGSRVLLVTDLPNATVSIDKLRTSSADRSLADVFSRLTIVQRGQDGRFIKSHSSLRTLSRIQDR